MRSDSEHGVGGNGARRRPRNTGHVEERSLGWPLEDMPSAPAPYDKSDVAAIKALKEGRADAYQQRLALEWIIYIAGTYENPWRPGVNGERDSSFAAGKAFVGQQIVKLINLPARDAAQGEQG